MKSFGLCCLLLAVFCGCTSAPVATKLDTEAITFLAGLEESLSAGTVRVQESTDRISQNVDVIAQEQKRIADAIEILTPKGNDSREEVIPSTESTSADPEPEESQSPIVPSSPADVPLYVTSTDGCIPCANLWKAVERGEFAGFAVQKSTDFPGLKSYPAIRYPDARSKTGWAVIYGYDSGTPALLRSVTNSGKNKTKTVTRSVGMSQSEMVALHNQLHGGGQWTWPGDLATHLAATHGVTTGGAPLTGAIFQGNGTNQITRQRSVVRSNSRGIFSGWWSRNSTR